MSNTSKLSMRTLNIRYYTCPQCKEMYSENQRHTCDSPTPPGTGVGDDALDTLLDDYNAAQIAFGASVSAVNEARVARAKIAIHAHVSAAVQEAVLKERREFAKSVRDSITLFFPAKDVPMELIGIINRIEDRRSTMAPETEEKND